MNQKGGSDAGPQRRVANRKRAGGHHVGEISKRIKNNTASQGSQILVSASQCFDIEDGSDYDEVDTEFDHVSSQWVSYNYRSINAYVCFERNETS